MNFLEKLHEPTSCTTGIWKYWAESNAKCMGKHVAQLHLNDLYGVQCPWTMPPKICLTSSTELTPSNNGQFPIRPGNCFASLNFTADDKKVVCGRIRQKKKFQVQLKSCTHEHAHCTWTQKQSTTQCERQVLNQSTTFGLYKRRNCSIKIQKHFVCFFKQFETHRTEILFNFTWNRRIIIHSLNKSTEIEVIQRACEENYMIYSQLNWSFGFRSKLGLVLYLIWMTKKTKKKKQTNEHHIKPALFS